MAGNAAPKNETPAQKLARITNRRVNKALSGIRGLQDVAELKPTVQQRERVFKALREAISESENAWTKGEKTAAGGFAL